MTTFKFHQDIKVSIWRRQHFEIEANSLEEAKAKAMKFQNEDVSNHTEFLYDELQYDTEELMTPEENGNFETMQLFAEKEECPFITNATPDIQQMQCRFNEYISAHQVAMRDLTGYESEEVCGYQGSVYHAFHKDDKLNVIVLAPDFTARKYMFNSSWNELVTTNDKFRSKMAFHLRCLNHNSEEIEKSLHEWFMGERTQMACTHIHANDNVPFSLGDVVKVWGKKASITEYHPAKLIGYQVMNEAGEFPEGMFSFQVIKDRTQAIISLAEAEQNEPQKGYFLVRPVYEGDIEEPTFI